MKKKTRETIVKILIIIGLILTVLCFICSFKLGITEDSNPQYKEYYIKTAILYILMIVDAIAMYILMGRKKRI